MNKLWKNFLIALVAMLLIIIGHYLRLTSPLESLAVGALSPVQQEVYGAQSRVGSFYDAWLAKRSLLQENQDLKNQLVSYQVEAAKIRALEDENALLKNELKFAETAKYKYVSARIISGVTDPYSQSIVINAGKNDGLDKGLAVVSAAGVLVGKILEANDNYSKVLLLTDDKSKVAAAVQNDDHTSGLVEGQFGLNFTLTNIPRDQQIKEGDLIVTSGLEGRIPKNLPIAKVESVKVVESEIFKTAILSPLLDFNNLSYVLVIIP